MGELLNCPFCGGCARIASDHGRDGSESWVTCNYCGSRSRSVYWLQPIEKESKHKAITAWNTRPAPSEAEVEAAAKRMVKLCSPPKGASFEQACEWVPPTIEDLARAALGVEP